MATYEELKRRVQASSNKDDYYVSEPESIKSEAKPAAKASAQTADKPASGNPLAGHKDSVVAFSLYVKLCEVLCMLDSDILLQNQGMINEKMFEDDRYVPVESVLFISQHIAEIMAMLTLDYKNIRNVCSDALNAEIMTDDMTAEQKLEFRSKTMDEHLLNPRDTFKMGFSVPSADMYAHFTELAKADMDKVRSNQKLMSAMENMKITNSERMICSVILSNHIYMLRVFSKNAMFLNQISDMIDKFRSEYGIK